ncbi:zinc ribbon domain-containing protein [Fictibacillus sp. WQ 8-8]|uniref:zinc ribbon domain-containing protein n=1 Tax=unclassified Fictibacillus TaxID=2644029 RepID=UPI0006A7E9D8|nr:MULTISPECIES: zinc ribbon domain-containing protein [unclassified Fictibacillus]MCQ6264303.1 zinc ribbon domain-containing protein [Fictibacillus sp. WQ 8-8]MED2971648.1 zinc ribbon domain-containing protein [Fictibacillus sp. B-59209]
MSRVTDEIRSRFKCVKCQHDQCQTKELAMTGSGLSKLLDIQHNHYLFVSCENCGYVEVYNPSILEGKKGQLGTIMDIFFG